MSSFPSPLTSSMTAAIGGEGAVGNDQVAVAVPVQVCRSKNAGGGEGVGGYGEALCTGHDVQAVTQ